jgi:hypothetical protein
VSQQRGLKGSKLLYTAQTVNRAQEKALEENESMDTASTQTPLLKNKHAVISRTMQQTYENVAHTLGVSKAQVVPMFVQRTLLKSLPTVADTVRVATFLASDGARTLTGAILNASSGKVID